MKHVVSLNLGPSAANYDREVDFFGVPMRVSHYGADFDLRVLEALLKHFDTAADYIALSGIHPVVQARHKVILSGPSERLKNLVCAAVLATGDRFRSVYTPWVLRAFERDNPGFFSRQRIAFYSGLADQPLLKVLREYSERFSFLDPYLHFGVRYTLSSVEALERYAVACSKLLHAKPLDVRVVDAQQMTRLDKLGFEEFCQASLYCSRASLLERFDLRHLKGKTVLLDTLPVALSKHLRDTGVRQVLHCLPKIPALKELPLLNFAVLEALFQAHSGDGSSISDNDVLEWITRFDLKPELRSFEQRRPKREHKPKFAFIIHPLTTSDLFRHPALRWMRPVAKKIEPVLEQGTSRLPGVLYGHIRGIRSAATGEETEGLIYTIFDTPKMILNQDPEQIYAKLLNIAQDASKRGADIIGLGAYTKIAGDAGVTVANRSPIPVTTGNSLSASATLWAARVAAERLGFLPQYRVGQPVAGRAMVIGATGSIGAVSAKMLASAIGELVLVSRTPDRLLDLRAEIALIAPQTNVIVATDPNPYAANCDVIVTSTSSIERRVLDIMSVKPGCVICDVSRPLDMREEDIIKRPDVLVIESGEIDLPGEVELTCDIGTPDSTVYACLAETALLALEGRMESFTLSRNISYNRVREIYDIARKHGARLSAIRGHSGIITDIELDLCREHALKALVNWPLSGHGGHTK